MAPRPTGGSAIAAARARCAAELRSMGLAVVERPFEFSQLPGRFATPWFGAAAALFVGLAGVAGSYGERRIPLFTLLAGAALLVIGGWWLTRYGVLALPVLRARGVNLEATAPGHTPAVWLVAHLDSKSQPIPTLVRTAGIVLEVMGYLVTVTLAALLAIGRTPHELFWLFAALMTLVGAVPVLLGGVGARSPGALDNASGVVTVIAAAQLLGASRAFGVLITDAEELGLAGARAWGRDQPAARVVLNCDGVDDNGEIQVMFNGRQPADLLTRIARASRSTGVAYQPGRLVPGILTDAVALGGAGRQAVTFSRGRYASLARVHTSRDDLAHLSGAGIPETATLMAATVRALHEET